jgi:hypothetical protein
MACPGFGQDYRTCRCESVARTYAYSSAGILFTPIHTPRAGGPRYGHSVTRRRRSVHLRTLLADGRPEPMVRVLSALREWRSAAPCPSTPWRRPGRAVARAAPAPPRLLDDRPLPGNVDVTTARLPEGGDCPRKARSRPEDGAPSAPLGPRESRPPDFKLRARMNFLRSSQRSSSSSSSSQHG